MEKYIVLLIGLDVMAQVPVKQPTYFQYKYPANAPNKAPLTISLLFINHFFIEYLFLLFYA